ncbi:hypothetical protein [Sphingosinicella rhizophila]|uniref:SlyX protein n=1 Tax=Sphingosinicella rhizophila TaxID=3050082 RepID=A0ABU3QAK7_9SPHN|nr:hypothetical protein [Sphingosinicella sp. GR2756]MDT9600028.1 hypothetical protein [Sphingosinicella sp. GR2756]
MTDYVVAGLVKKRAELAGELESTHERLRVLVNQLESLDNTLRIVAPDMEVEAIRPEAFRPPDDWSKRGQDEPLGAVDPEADQGAAYIA